MYVNCFNFLQTDFCDYSQVLIWTMSGNLQQNAAKLKCSSFCLRNRGSVRIHCHAFIFFVWQYFHRFPLTKWSVEKFGPAWLAFYGNEKITLNIPSLPIDILTFAKKKWCGDVSIRDAAQSSMSNTPLPTRRFSDRSILDYVQSDSEPEDDETYKFKKPPP